MYENTLAAIVAVNHDLIDDLVESVRDKMNDTRIRQITKDDYFTYLTPEGELYDKSVLPRLVFISCTVPCRT